MDAALPLALRDTLDTLVEGRSGRDLAERAQAISTLYRSGAGSTQAIRSEDDALAYALTRMPATYAAVRAALEALGERAPDFLPRSVADVGCGPGTASWAAMAAFDLTKLHLIDQNRALIGLAHRLLSPLSTVSVQDDVRSIAAAAIPTSDLVIAAYVLAEMSEPAALAAVEAMWAATGGALVLVEPGTPAAWARLMAIRAVLIDRGGTVAAPCPHHAPCPVLAPDWCHFSQRLPRLRAHRLAKGAEVPFEDEKYAYLAVVRPRVALHPPRARVLAPPIEDKAALSLKLCEPAGSLELRRIGKRDKTAYRAVRRADWGDQVD